MEPASPNGPVESSRPESSNEPGKGIRILLVEDHADIARVLATLLARAGHIVTTAGSMARAEQIATTSGPFDLLISDLSLPDGSGLELKRRLRSIPGIAVSGYSTEVDLQECLDAGFMDLLAKPIEFAALKELIRRIDWSKSPTAERDSGTREDGPSSRE
ncbi:response regulator [Tautonia marina]|uniref:response regulator n=1 Tax=Tautonia marina TaxID=2653855 RepID=UPI001260D047|nr:response regulator [Tautonia marina]